MSFLNMHWSNKLSIKYTAQNTFHKSNYFIFVELVVACRYSRISRSSKAGYCQELAALLLDGTFLQTSVPTVFPPACYCEVIMTVSIQTVLLQPRTDHSRWTLISRTCQQLQSRAASKITPVIFCSPSSAHRPP